MLSPHTFPGLWGYIPFTVNSLLWGLVVMVLIHWIRLIPVKSGPAGSAMAAVLLCAGLSVSSLYADEWPAARVTQIFSDNGRYFVRIVPGNNYGDTIGFKGSPKGDPARGEFYARQSDRSYRLVADVAPPQSDRASGGARQ